jgi:putative hydrolase of HD superfamily
MSDATDVVDAQIEAFRAKDVERFLSCYADDVSVVLFDGTPMLKDKEVMREDKEVMREQYGKVFADSPDLRVTIANRATVGEFVANEEHITGVHLEGMPDEYDAVSVYRVMEGKIARLMLLL